MKNVVKKKGYVSVQKARDINFIFVENVNPEKTMIPKLNKIRIGVKMIIKERIIYRKIYLSYRDIMRLFDIKLNIIKSSSDNIVNIDGGSITTGVFGGELQVWDKKTYSLEHWEVTFCREEIRKYLSLFDDERLNDTEYVVFNGYNFIVETTNKNLKKIEDSLKEIRKTKGFLRRRFDNINPREIGVKQLEDYSCYIKSTNLEISSREVEVAIADNLMRQGKLTPPVQEASK